MPYFVISVTGYITQMCDVEFFLQCNLPNLEYKYYCNFFFVMSYSIANNFNLSILYEHIDA